jgi:hypothetical protein
MTGGKTRRGRITKMGDRYLRKLLVIGACGMLRHRRGHNDALRLWASGIGLPFIGASGQKSPSHAGQIALPHLHRTWAGSPATAAILASPRLAALRSLIQTAAERAAEAIRNHWDIESLH